MAPYIANLGARGRFEDSSTILPGADRTRQISTERPWERSEIRATKQPFRGIKMLTLPQGETDWITGQNNRGREKRLTVGDRLDRSQRGGRSSGARKRHRGDRSGERDGSHRRGKWAPIRLYANSVVARITCRWSISPPGNPSLPGKLASAALYYPLLCSS